MPTYPTTSQTIEVKRFIDNRHEEMLDRIEELEASLALMTAILTRTETRVCKLLEHLGALHLVNSQPRNPSNPTV